MKALRPAETKATSETGTLKTAPMAREVVLTCTFDEPRQVPSKHTAVHLGKHESMPFDAERMA
jgi:hypothetical protein